MPYLDSPCEKVEALDKARGAKPASDIEVKQLEYNLDLDISETYCNPSIMVRRAWSIIPDECIIHRFPA